MASQRLIYLEVLAYNRLTQASYGLLSFPALVGLPFKHKVLKETALMYVPSFLLLQLVNATQDYLCQMGAR